jgi:cytochrome c
MMDTWEGLKIGAAVAGTVLALSAIRWIDDRVFPVSGFAQLAYKVPGVSEPVVDLASLQRSWPAGLSETDGRTKLRGYMSNIEKVSVPTSPEGPALALAAPEPQLDLATLLAAADAKKGQQTAQVCTSCHTFEQGGPDRTGPNLWGIVGRNVASRKTFTYSSAFSAQTGSWTYERLDRYLTSPAKAVPGNKMPFAGLRKAEDRANVIAFLSTLSPSPVPFPKPEKPKIVETPPQRSGAGSARAGDQALASQAKRNSVTGDEQKR